MKMPYSVPPTYFASLQERLGEIPRKSSRPRRGFVFVLGNLAGAVFIVAATLICSELLDRKDSAFNEADAIVALLSVPMFAQQPREVVRFSGLFSHNEETFFVK